MRGWASPCRISANRLPATGARCRTCFSLPSDSLAGASRVRKIYVAFGDNAAQGRKACALLIDRIERALGGAPSIIAEGVDKFAISAAGYMGLVETLEFLHWLQDPV